MKALFTISFGSIVFGVSEIAITQDVTERALPADVRAYIRSGYESKYSELRAFYDSGVTPDLIEMLDSATDDWQLPRVAGMLGIVGDERAVEPLIRFVEKPAPRELSMGRHEARRVALTSLGLLVKRTGSERALSYLIDGLTPNVWRQRRVQGVVSYRSSQDEYDSLLSTYAIFGLAMSGHPRAREALLSLQRSPSVDQMQFRDGLDDTLEQWLEVHQLVAERGVSGMYEHYRTQREGD